MAVEKSAAGIPMRHLTVVSTHGQDILPPSPFVDSGASMQGGSGSGRPSSPTRRPGGDHSAGVPSENLICPICGIVTTSEGHLKEHLAGRRHQKNLERLQQQGMAHLHVGAAAAAGGNQAEDENEEEEPNTPPASGAAVTTPSTTTPNAAGGPFSSSSSSTPTPQLATLSTIDRLPSSLSDAFLRRSSSLHRNPSGNVYEGFPCVRVGDHILPSSMDLRAFLDEMQQVGDIEPYSEPLPPIDEAAINPDKRPRGGGGDAGGGGGASALSPGSDSKSIGGGGGGSYRTGRPPPPPRPINAQRGATSGSAYGHHHGGHIHQQQYQQQYQQGGGGGYSSQQPQQGWSPQRGTGRARYPSRFGQDPNTGGGGGGGTVGSPTMSGYNPAVPRQYPMQYPAMAGYHQAHQLMQHGHPVAFVPAIAAYPTAMAGAHGQSAGMGLGPGMVQAAPGYVNHLGARMVPPQQTSYYYTVPMGQHQQHAMGQQGWRQQPPPPGEN